MADYTIKKHGDFLATVDINFQAPDGTLTPIDTADYTITCKIRDRIDHPDRPEQFPAPQEYLPGNVATFTVAVVAGEPSQVTISMTDTVTGTFTSTQYAEEEEMPLLNFSLLETATGLITQTTSQTVEIIESQAY